MRAAAARIYASWSGVQRAFFWLGIAQLATAAVHAAIAFAFGGSLEGPVSIRKPILFAQSFGLVSLSFAFTFHDLGLPPRAVGFLGWTSIVLSGLEVVLAAVQFWRGVPSHFNYATLLDGAIAGTMTAGAIAFALFLGAVTMLAWRGDLASHPTERRSFVHGVRLSLPLALFGLSAVGMVMLLNGGHLWRGFDVLAGSVQNFRLGHGEPAGPGGFMLAHALGTHVLQVLPLADGWPAAEARRNRPGARAWTRLPPSTRWPWCSPPRALSGAAPMAGMGTSSSSAPASAAASRALRLVEKGYRVLLLEKGRRFGRDDFPKTNWDLQALAVDARSSGCAASSR